MQSGSETQPACLPTLMSCARAMEQYADLVSKIGVPSPAVNLSALDAYLLQQMAAHLPNRATVVDLAAAATGGASLVCWLSAANVAEVIAPHTDSDNDDWRTGFRQAAEAMGINAVVLSAESAEQALKAQANQLSPIIITLAQTEADAAKLGERLNALFALQPKAAIFLLTLGNVGSSEVLTQAVNFASANSNYRIVALRECNHFWATSRLGMIHLANNSDLPAALRRLQQLYEGNFQFTNLVQLLTELEVRTQKDLMRERHAFEALQSSISLQYELKRWIWRKLPAFMKRLIKKLRRREE
ncbi:MAG: hypothetical protein ACKVZH_28240 [Blastocatellia bacterium]